VFYGHVLGFKGLERPVVILASDGFRDPTRAEEVLYVGLSRVRALLVVCGDITEIAAVGGEGVRHRLNATRHDHPQRVTSTLACDHHTRQVRGKPKRGRRAGGPPPGG
jgi:hypothetical protein